MAHPEQLAFVKTVAEQLSSDWRPYSILEIGSYDVNGSVRPFFKGAEYIGVDLCEGPGVDVIGEGDSIDLGLERFELTISCECFEHNPKWRETFLNMFKQTCPGGVVLLTCASTGRIEHGTRRTSACASPGSQSVGWDYYRNISKWTFSKSFDLNEMFSSHFIVYNLASRDLYFLGIKKGNPVFGDSASQIKEKALKEIRRHESEKNDKSLLQRVKSTISNAPILLAFFVSDSVFQDVQMSWGRFLSKAKRVIAKPNRSGVD